jgi:hypothetical protein
LHLCNPALFSAGCGTQAAHRSIDGAKKQKSSAHYKPRLLSVNSRHNYLRLPQTRKVRAADWGDKLLRNDLQIPTVKEEISRFSSHYNVRISVYPMPDDSNKPKFDSGGRKLRGD